MTNREKFKEVFGVDITRFYRVCNILDVYEECHQRRSCDDCPFKNFWDKEYVGQPSRKGHWIIDDKEGSRIWECHCSECNKDPQEDFIHGTENWWVNKLPDFCPHCGADMEDKDGDNK